MIKITRIRVVDDSGGILKTRHCDIMTDDLERTRYELSRQYMGEYGKKVKVSLCYREGDCVEENSVGEQEKGGGGY